VIATEGLWLLGGGRLGLEEDLAPQRNHLLANSVPNRCSRDWL